MKFILYKSLVIVLCQICPTPTLANISKKKFMQLWSPNGQVFPKKWWAQCTFRLCAQFSSVFELGTSLYLIHLFSLLFLFLLWLLRTTVVLSSSIPLYCSRIWNWSPTWDEAIMSVVATRAEKLPRSPQLQPNWPILRHSPAMRLPIAVSTDDHSTMGMSK